MEDGKANEGDTPGKTTDTTSKDVKKPIEKTETERLKAENDDFEKEIARKENLRAKAQQGGRSSAGGEVKEKTQDEKDEEAAAVFMNEDE